MAQGLSLRVLYEKYTEKCKETHNTPGKLHLYRTIFNTEFNIEFQSPKKDRCDTCEAMKMNDHPTDAQKDAHDAHLAGKLETKTEHYQTCRTFVLARFAPVGDTAELLLEFSGVIAAASSKFGQWQHRNESHPDARAENRFRQTDSARYSSSRISS